MEIIKLAVRNVLRNPRRSLLDMAAFVICLSMIVFFVGVYRFRIVDGVSKATRYRSAHLQIHARGYDAIARKLPLNLALADAHSIQTALLADPRVRMASERIRFFCHIAGSGDMLHASATAIDPTRERETSLLPEALVTGRFLDGADAGVLLPERLARWLGVAVGDSVRLKARTSHDVPNLVDAVVIGIVRPPFNSLDQSVFFMPLEFAREFLEMEGRSTEIAVMTRDISDAPPVAFALAARLTPARRAVIEVFDWKRYEPALVADIFIDTRFLAVFFSILLLISVFIMNNSMSMSVFERMREFGTLRALGMSRERLLALVSSESVLIGAAGALAGCFLGGLLCWYFGVHGIPTDVGELSSIPVSPRFYVISRPEEYAACIALGALSGWLGGIRAALRARSLNIVEVLHAG